MFTVPGSISLALGLQMILFLVCPSWYPTVHERILDLHWMGVVAVNASLCIALPLMLLYCITRKASV